MRLSPLRQTALLLLSGAALLSSCRKDDPTSLEGALPAANFTAQVNTSQYPVVVTFTNTSTDAFLYQWDFGDGSPLASGATVTHTYRTPGTFKAKLVAAGRGGSNTATHDVVVPSVCDNTGFAVLTACGGSGATSWTYDVQAGAIVRLGADGTTVISSSATLPECQGDDQFSFTSTFSYSYDAGKETFGTNGACGKALSGNSDFVYLPNAKLGSLKLLRNGAFIGLADSVVNKTYEIIEATPTRLRLQGTLPNGMKTVITLMPQLSALDRAKRLLTGGSSRTWMLDMGAAPITVGTESAPTSYYPGAAAGTLPTCQSDDEYTFTNDNTLIYNAKDQTFVAGDYTCQAPRSQTTPFEFGPASGAGLAQFVLTKPGSFIGVTDAPASRIYRILSITDTDMVLRAGSATADPVFTIHLKVK